MKRRIKWPQKILVLPIEEISLRPELSSPPHFRTQGGGVTLSMTDGEGQTEILISRILGFAILNLQNSLNYIILCVAAPDDIFQRISHLITHLMTQLFNQWMTTVFEEQCLFSLTSATWCHSRPFLMPLDQYAKSQSFDWARKFNFRRSAKLLYLFSQ